MTSRIQTLLCFQEYFILVDLDEATPQVSLLHMYGVRKGSILKYNQLTKE